jgi:hypothetical protein
VVSRGPALSPASGIAPDLSSPPGPDAGTALFPLPGPGARRALERAFALIEELFPLPARFRPGLPRNVAELSRLLTGGRGERDEGYLGQPPLLSAYLRYFLPWNLYRLSRLLPSLPLALSPGDALTDLGSGPLTLPLGLWLFRPELRAVPLEVRCLDRTGAGLEAGKKLFAALAGSGCPWTIRTIRASLGAPVRGPRAALVTAVDLFTETLRDIPAASVRALGQTAEKQGRLLSALAAETGSILVLEPGVPQSGAFIAALRRALLDLGRPPLAPCLHAETCPLPGPQGTGGAGKWCHFAFGAEGVPSGLRRLSAAAGLPKERVVLSFLLAGPRGQTARTGAAREELPVRIISDAFPVASGGGYGRYGCSSRGLVLMAGSRGQAENQVSGTALRMVPDRREKRDPKSGALALEFSMPHPTHPSGV